MRIQNTKTNMTTMVLSDREGGYRVDEVAPGAYEVWATWVGYRSDPVRRRNVTVEDGSRLRLDFIMKNDTVAWS